MIRINWQELMARYQKELEKYKEANTFNGQCSLIKSKRLE
ncbi:hypothetical protein B14911_13202 [Bacillus sp. NRRL B-14911]|nr:hypothetical protein B14911_13202 [Bacillus sp. NRRL B-14911]